MLLATSVTLHESIVASNFLGAAPSSAPSDITGMVDLARSFNVIRPGGSGGLVDGVHHNIVIAALRPNTERLTMGRLKAIAAEVERIAMNPARTHNMSLASARLRNLASEIPDGLQHLAPVWEHDLASYNPQTAGSRRTFKRQLLADLKDDVAAGVAAGEFGLTGPGAAAYLASAVLPQASRDSVTIFNSTGFGITVSASLNGTDRLPARTIANGTSSLFDFGSSTNNFISINVSRTDNKPKPPPVNFPLSKPFSGYDGKLFTVSRIGDQFSVSV
jgi:hypothetical protein